MKDLFWVPELMLQLEGSKLNFSLAMEKQTPLG